MWDTLKRAARPPAFRRHDAFVAGTDLATVAGRLGHAGGGKTTLAIYGQFLRDAAPDRAAADLLAMLVRPPALPPTAEA